VPELADAAPVAPPPPATGRRALSFPCQLRASGAACRSRSSQAARSPVGRGSPAAPVRFPIGLPQDRRDGLGKPVLAGELGARRMRQRPTCPRIFATPTNACRGIPVPMQDLRIAVAAARRQATPDLFRFGLRPLGRFGRNLPKGDTIAAASPSQKFRFGYDGRSMACAPNQRHIFAFFNFRSYRWRAVLA